MEHNEALISTFEVLMKVPNFKDNIQHLVLPEFLYEKYNLPKPEIQDMKTYLNNTMKHQFMPGSQLEIRKPAPGGVRDISGINVIVTSDMSGNTNIDWEEPSDTSTFKKVVKPDYDISGNTEHWDKTDYNHRQKLNKQKEWYDKNTTDYLQQYIDLSLTS